MSRYYNDIDCRNRISAARSPIIYGCSVQAFNSRWHVNIHTSLSLPLSNVHRNSNFTVEHERASPVTRNKSNIRTCTYMYVRSKGKEQTCYTPTCRIPFGLVFSPPPLLLPPPLCRHGQSSYVNGERSATRRADASTLEGGKEGSDCCLELISLDSPRTSGTILIRATKTRTIWRIASSCSTACGSPSDR